MPSKYTLVHLAARRAREVNAYYHSLGEGLGRYTPPLVDQVASNKPLSIALEEIAAGKLVAQEPGEAMRVAEQLLGGLEDSDAFGDEGAQGGHADVDDAGAEGEDAEVVALDPTGTDADAGEAADADAGDLSDPLAGVGDDAPDDEGEADAPAPDDEGEADAPAPDEDA